MIQADNLRSDLMFAKPMPAILLAIVFADLGAATRVSAETWTNLRGTSSVEAEMVGLWGNQLVLAMGDGRRVTVSMDDLRAESRIQAQRLADSKNHARMTRINELKLQADVAASPAPDPLPQPPTAQPYVRPDHSADAAAHFKAIDEQLRAGHVLAIFDALPASYQKDLDELVKLAATKTSGITWRSLVVSVHQLGDVIVTRQNWFFSHPRFDVAESQSPDETQRLNETILTFAGMIRSATDLDSLEPSKLQTMPLRQWLAERDAAMAPYIAELFQRSSVSPPEFTVESQKGKAVSLKISTAGLDATEPTNKTVPMTKVDDVLVPTSIADAWKNLIPDVRKKLEEADEGSLMADPATVVVLSVLGPLVNPLGQAQSRNEFHTAMQPLVEIAAPTLEAFRTNIGVGQ